MYCICYMLLVQFSLNHIIKIFGQGKKDIKIIEKHIKGKIYMKYLP